MERRVFWIYAAVLTAALLVAFAEEAGVSGDPAALALVAPADIAVLTIDVALVWVFAGLGIKARVFETGREAVSGPEAPVTRKRSSIGPGGTKTGVFARPGIGRP